jgi:hypothetical protein
MSFVPDQAAVAFHAFEDAQAALERKLLGDPVYGGYVNYEIDRPTPSRSLYKAFFATGQSAGKRAWENLKRGWKPGDKSWLHLNHANRRGSKEGSPFVQMVDIPLEGWVFRFLDVDLVEGWEGPLEDQLEARGLLADWLVEKSRAYYHKTTGNGFHIVVKFRTTGVEVDDQWCFNDWAYELYAAFWEAHPGYERDGVYPCKHDTSVVQRRANSRAAGAPHHKTGLPCRILGTSNTPDYVVDETARLVNRPTRKKRATPRHLEHVPRIEFNDERLRETRDAVASGLAGIADGGDRASARRGLIWDLKEVEGHSLENVIQIVDYRDERWVRKIYEREVTSPNTIGTFNHHVTREAAAAYVAAKNALRAELAPEAPQDAPPPIRLARGTPRDMRALLAGAEALGDKALYKQVNRACVCGRKIGEVFGVDTHDTLWTHRASCDRIYCSSCMAKRIEATKVLLEDEDREVHFVRFPWDYKRSKADRSILRMVPGSYETEEVLLGASVHRGYDEKGDPLTLVYSFDEGILDAGRILAHVKAGATLHSLKGEEAVKFLLEAIEASHSGIWAGSADEAAARLAEREKTRWVVNGTNAPRFATTKEGRDHVMGLAIKAREESGEELEEVGGYETIAPDGTRLAISSHPVPISRYLELLQAYDLGFTPRVLSRADFVYERRSSLSLAQRYG